MAQTLVTFPVVPSQVAFRDVDRRYPGLTTIGYEQRVADHVRPDLLRRAVVRVSQRHEILRTTVVDSDEDVDPSSTEYVWRGFRNAVAEQPVVSFEAMSAPDVGDRITGEPAWLPGLRVDPSRLPVFRFQLVDAGAHRILRIVTDHALCDRWSLFVLQRDLERAYKQELEAVSAPAAETGLFSAFATNLHSLWTSGSFDQRLLRIEKEIAELDMTALPGTAERVSDSALVRSFVVSLGPESTARFEAAYARVGTTRFAVAVALFAGAIGAEFDWRRLAFLIPHANRSASALGSVGLFADAHYVFTHLTAGFEALVHEVANALEGARVQVPPPAALVQAVPATRDVLEAAPRLAADVTIQPRRGRPRRAGRAEIFVERPSEEQNPVDRDAIDLSSPPSFPAQPDLRLTCDFSQQHQLSVNFRVDRVGEAAAQSVAERLLRQIQGLPT